MEEPAPSGDYGHSVLIHDGYHEVVQKQCDVSSNNKEQDRQSDQSHYGQYGCLRGEIALVEIVERQETEDQKRREYDKENETETDAPQKERVSQ